MGKIQSLYMVSILLSCLCLTILFTVTALSSNCNNAQSTEKFIDELVRQEDSRIVGFLNNNDTIFMLLNNKSLHRIKSYVLKDALLERFKVIRIPDEDFTRFEYGIRLCEDNFSNNVIFSFSENGGWKSLDISKPRWSWQNAQK